MFLLCKHLFTLQIPLSPHSPILSFSSTVMLPKRKVEQLLILHMKTTIFFMMTDTYSANPEGVSSRISLESGIPHEFPIFLEHLFIFLAHLILTDFTNISLSSVIFTIFLPTHILLPISCGYTYLQIVKFSMSKSKRQSLSTCCKPVNVLHIVSKITGHL